MAESAGRPLTLLKCLDNVKLALQYWDHNELGNPVTRLNIKWRIAAVPARHLDLSLVVTVDQTYEISQNDPVFVAETGPRKQYGCE